MNNLHSPIGALKREDIALEIIATALKNGYLSLFVGAGVSKAATDQFPDWYKLVERCCKKVGIDFDSTSNQYSNKDLRQFMEKVENYCLSNRGQDYLKLVKELLYEGVNYDVALMKTELLISLGSLVMGSIRGSAKSVINYNFDDLLEWYLEFHGFQTQVISEFPTIIKKSDVSIYHPHGFLPYEPRFKECQSNKIILSQKSYLRSYKEVDSWNEFQIGQLSSKLGLFIGLSGEDEHIELLCERAFERVKKTDNRSILGYIILVDNEKNRNLEEIHQNRGLINLYINDHDELPQKLLDISRTAAQVNVSY